MEFGNDIALVALIVSLVALTVSIGQVLQAYFGTAEGYRRCQSSVIGPWAKYTRLRWRWSEFRFETRFTTPEICLLTDEERVNPKSIKNVWRWRKLRWEPELTAGATCLPPHGADCDEKNESSTIDPVLRRGSGFHYRKEDLLDFDISDTAPYVPQALRETVTTSRANRVRDTDLVSWTRFLRSLHQYQQTAEPAVKIAERQAECQSAEDARVTIRLNEWSWDLVPPDLVRPYATSTVGTMTVLAHRLGMQWTSLNPSKGEMNAEGCGHDISCASVRGLGIVLYYNYNARLDPYSVRTKPWTRRPDIPTHAADKLRCGIIPPSDLKTGEYSLVGQNNDHSPLAATLSRLQVGRQAQAILEDELHTLVNKPSTIRHVLNDMVCLACPFMPLPEDDRNHITWPILTSGLNSPLVFWEGRKALLRRSQQYVRDHNLQSGHPAQIVATKLAYLATRYHSDFYSIWATAVRGQELKTFISELREIYNQTSKTLRAHGLVGPKYTALLGAHLTMATEAGRSARKARASGRARVEEREGSSQRQYNVPDYISEVAHEYVDRIERVSELVGEPIEGLWWTLMLRGICWSMSVNVTRRPLVPSYLYYSATPVYMI